MDKFVEFAPIIVVTIAFIFQNRLFVTPEQLEKKHREILEDIDEKYSTKEDNEELRRQIYDMRSKIDKIYDKLIGSL